jgi:hypothetical protein
MTRGRKREKMTEKEKGFCLGSMVWEVGLDIYITAEILLEGVGVLFPSFLRSLRDRFHINLAQFSREPTHPSMVNEVLIPYSYLTLNKPQSLLHKTFSEQKSQPFCPSLNPYPENKN